MRKAEVLTNIQTMTQCCTYTHSPLLISICITHDKTPSSTTCEYLAIYYTYFWEIGIQIPLEYYSYLGIYVTNSHAKYSYLMVRIWKNYTTWRLTCSNITFACFQHVKQFFFSYMYVTFIMYFRWTEKSYVILILNYRTFFQNWNNLKDL